MSLQLHQLKLAGVVVPLVAALEACAADPVTCARKSSDTHGYLLQACIYVKKHRINVASDPNSWTIRRIEKRVVAGKPLTVVYYSCCYLGDMGYFDEADRLVDYIVGAK